MSVTGVPTRTIDYGPRGTVRVYADGEALAQAAAALLAETVASATGHAYIALSGGSTPKRMGQLLAGPSYQETIPWRNIEFFWGDERFVPEDNPESNSGEARRTFLDKVDVEPSRINPFPTHGPATPASPPRCTLPSSKRSSTRPMSRRASISSSSAWVTTGTPCRSSPARPRSMNRSASSSPTTFPKLDTTRLTLTAPVVNAAQRIAFLVGGSGKAETLAKVLDGPVDVNTLPSQIIRPTDGELLWLVDEAAATDLARQSAASNDQ